MKVKHTPVDVPSVYCSVSVKEETLLMTCSDNTETHELLLVLGEKENSPKGR